jgi:hypothetical protein
MSAAIAAPAASSLAATAPVSSRAAIAVLGTMLFLIVALTVLLVHSTWVNPASAAETPPAIDQNLIAQR